MQSIGNCHTQTFIFAKILVVMPESIELVLGRDFTPRGMETCRGSIPLLSSFCLKEWRGYLGPQGQESEDADDKGTAKLML